MVSRMRHLSRVARGTVLMREKRQCMYGCDVASHFRDMDSK